MTASGGVRQAGPTAHEIADKTVEEGAELMAEEVPEERATKWRSTTFARMRTDWTGPDAIVLQQAIRLTQEVLADTFGDAYSILYRIYEVVRIPVMDGDEPKRDADGLVVWARNVPDGSYHEDYSLLGPKLRENVVLEITTHLPDWAARAEDLRLGALLAKGMWTEKAAIEYDLPDKGRIEDREAQANIHSMDERYFALFQSALSRKADALVRTMELLALRLKETIV